MRTKPLANVVGFVFTQEYVEQRAHENKFHYEDQLTLERIAEDEAKQERHECVMPLSARPLYPGDHRNTG